MLCFCFRKNRANRFRIVDLKVLAIYTDFKQHGEDAGYKQILKYIRPFKTLGINERDDSIKHSDLKKKYNWLFEFEAYKYRKQIDLIHILYAENYLRWSPRLFSKIPIVATFHQPVELLEREVMRGDFMGRVGRITHILNKKRFEKLAAAIVTNVSQVAVLEKVMPKEKIHVISLGVHLKDINAKFDRFFSEAMNREKASGNILTVGNWQRDWDFYFSVVEKCQHLNFSLVNNKLEDEYKEKVKAFKNLTFLDDITDEELSDLFLRSDFQFIPVKSLAGSNALLQGLAYGCPLVLTDVNAEEFKSENDIVKLYKKGSVEDCVNKMNELLGLSQEEFAACKKKAHLFANRFSWEEVAKKTIDVYKLVI